MRRKVFNLAAVLSLALCVGAWLAGSFGNHVTRSGILIWSSGHNELNTYYVTERFGLWGFWRIRGFEAGHAVNFVVAPHWAFLILVFPAILWSALAVIGEAQRQQRWVGGGGVFCESVRYVRVSSN